jgi:hypothetical protein
VLVEQQLNVLDYVVAQEIILHFQPLLQQAVAEVQVKHKHLQLADQAAVALEILVVKLVLLEHQIRVMLEEIHK